MVDSGRAIIIDVVQPANWNQMPEAIRNALRIAPDLLVALSVRGP
jgi:hypothetical protein